MNFFGRDEEYGPIILSVKVEEEEYRVIIRCRDGNFERKFKLQNDSSGPLEWAKSVVPMLTAKGCRFNPVLCINAWQRIGKYSGFSHLGTPLIGRRWEKPL